MQNWSKWILEDTAMELSYGKSSTGIGGSYSWKSKKSGEGSMTITNLDANKMLSYDLSFKDWDGVSKVKMELKPEGKMTEVSWSMKDEGEFPFLMRGMMFVMNMNGKVKKDFEKGLENLENYLKKHPNTLLANGYTITEGQFAGADYLSKRAVVKFPDMPNYFATHFAEIGKLAGAAIKGAPCALYYKYDEKAMNADMAAAMPVGNKSLGNEVYTITSVPASKEYVLDYNGAYDKMMPAYQTMDSIIKMHGHTNPELVIEEYITDPMIEKDTSKWSTIIHFLVK
jgi:effector-binding domain-containing protein